MSSVHACTLLSLARAAVRCASIAHTKRHDICTHTYFETQTQADHRGHMCCAQFCTCSSQLCLHHTHTKRHVHTRAHSDSQTQADHESHLCRAQFCKCSSHLCLQATVRLSCGAQLHSSSVELLLQGLCLCVCVCVCVCGTQVS